MANHASATKAARQAEKRRLRNQAGKAKLRTQVKALRTAATEKKGKDVLIPLLNDAQRALMKAASKNLIERGTASRQVSRLSQVVNRSLAAAK